MPCFHQRLVLGAIFRVFVSVPFLMPAGALAGDVHGASHHHHGDASDDHHAGHMHGEIGRIGHRGMASEVSRTVTVTMMDNRFSPERIDVKKGETVRFIVKNRGDFVHEFNIGTHDTHKAHRKEMMMMVENGVLEPSRINRDRMNMPLPGGGTMKHDDPNSVLLEPKKTREIIWKFGTDSHLEFACNIPGHYESGMVGKIAIH